MSVILNPMEERINPLIRTTMATHNQLDGGGRSSSPSSKMHSTSLRLPPLTSLLSVVPQSQSGGGGNNRAQHDSIVTSPTPRREQLSPADGAFRFQVAGREAMQDQNRLGSSGSSSRTSSLHHADGVGGDATSSKWDGREAPRASDVGLYHQIDDDRGRNALSSTAHTADEHVGRGPSVSDPLPSFNTLDIPSRAAYLSPPETRQRLPPTHSASYDERRSEASADHRYRISPVMRSTQAPSSRSYHHSPGHTFARPIVERRGSHPDLGRPAEESDIFARLYHVLATARRYTDHHSASSSAEQHRLHDVRSALPTVREGDFTGLFSNLQYELDMLHRLDPRAARELEFDAQTLQRHLDEFLYRREEDVRLTASNAVYDRADAYSGYPSSSTISQRYAPYDRPARGGGVYRRPSEIFLSDGGSGGTTFRPAQVSSDPSDGRYRYGSGGGGGGGGGVEYGAATYQRGDGYHDGGGGGGGDGGYGAAAQYGASTQHRSTPLTDRYGRLLSVGGGHVGRAGGAMQTFAPSVAYVTSAAPMPKRVRKRRDEVVQTCLSCAASETPEWRKGPTGPRTLCNACGLLFAKQCRKRELELQQAHGKRSTGRPRVGGAERMTNEEREHSLLELQMAVQARANQSGQSIVATPQPMPILPPAPPQADGFESTPSTNDGSHRS